MKDAALIVRAAATVVATDTSGALDLTQGVGGFNPDSMPPGGAGLPVLLVIPVTAIDFDDANETYVAKLQQSADNATWVDASPGVSLLAKGQAQVGAFVNSRYVRSVITIGGTTPSITFNDAYIEPLVAHLA